MFRAYSAFYSPEELQILDAVLEGAMRQLAPDRTAVPGSDLLRVEVAAAILRVAENGITDADRMIAEALQLMRQEWG